MNDLPSLWCCCHEVEGTVQALVLVPGLMIYGGSVETGTDHSLLPTESHFKLANINKAWPVSGTPLTQYEEEEVHDEGYVQGFCTLCAHRERETERERVANAKRTYRGAGGHTWS